MIIGAHSIIYSINPEADRAFLRDVLRLSHVDVGDGWLIFGLPPAEVAVHPSSNNDVHEFYLMCEDVEALVGEMQRHGISCAAVEDLGWGIRTHVMLPGGGQLGIYQPRHARPANDDGKKGEQAREQASVRPEDHHRSAPARHARSWPGRGSRRWLNARAQDSGLRRHPRQVSRLELRQRVATLHVRGKARKLFLAAAGPAHRATRCEDASDHHVGRVKRSPDQPRTARPSGQRCAPAPRCALHLRWQRSIHGCAISPAGRMCQLIELFAALLARANSERDHAQRAAPLGARNVGSSARSGPDRSSR